MSHHEALRRQVQRERFLLDQLLPQSQEVNDRAREMRLAVRRRFPELFGRRPQGAGDR